MNTSVSNIDFENKNDVDHLCEIFIESEEPEDDENIPCIPIQPAHEVQYQYRARKPSPKKVRAVSSKSKAVTRKIVEKKRSPHPSDIECKPLHTLKIKKVTPKEPVVENGKLAISDCNVIVVTKNQLKQIKKGASHHVRAPDAELFSTMNPGDRIMFYDGDDTFVLKYVKSVHKLLDIENVYDFLEEIIDTVDEPRDYEVILGF